MKNTLSNISEILKLNGERKTRNYSAEITNTIHQGKKKSNTSIALLFDLTYAGMKPDKQLHYKLDVNKRYFLNEKNSAIKKLNKAQTIAEKVASISNTIHFITTKNLKLVKALNTAEIRKKWETVKIDLFKDFPDLESIAEDFDWQLQEENIQQLFLEDNFYNFLFSNLFYHPLDKNNPIIEDKIISNGIGQIAIPITEHKIITKQDRAFTNVEITTTADINAESNRFSLAKLNAFIGDLDTEAGKNYPLDFNYKGIYRIKPEIGLVTQGILEYEFSIGETYNKTTKITFNLDSNE